MLTYGRNFLQIWICLFLSHLENKETHKVFPQESWGLRQIVTETTVGVERLRLIHFIKTMASEKYRDSW